MAALTLSQVKGASGRTKVMPVDSMGGDVVIRILPMQKIHSLKDIKQPEGLSDFEKQFHDAANLISACLTDDDKTTLSYEEAMALCTAEGGLDGAQINDLAAAISEANGLTLGN